jgi:hypothetical protein
MLTPPSNPEEVVMRRLLPVALSVALAGCGGPITPELYALVVDYFRPPASCYTNGMAPTDGVTTAPPHIIQVEVWDGPDNTAFLEVQSGGGRVDMGDAPDVNLTGVFKGTRGSEGWTFSTQRVTVNTAANTTITDTTGATFTFNRGTTFKGTASLSSSRACMGSLCTGTQPSCTISGITVSGTRLAVDYQKAP